VLFAPEQVRSVSVQPRRVPLEELRVAAPRLERRTSVEASMRLDALASAGFRVSRSAMTDLIKKGDVRCVFVDQQACVAASLWVELHLRQRRDRIWP
jgi:RNA-binding protein YlmH